MITIILTILLIIALCMCVYFLIRNSKVRKFRRDIIDLVYSRVTVMINNGASHRDAFYLWDRFDDISYDEMLYSFKPLKIEYWFTDEELKLLGYERKRLD